jgi:hypothetical protein
MMFLSKYLDMLGYELPVDAVVELTALRIHDMSSLDDREPADKEVQSSYRRHPIRKS